MWKPFRPPNGVIQESISLRISRRAQIKIQFLQVRPHTKWYIFVPETWNDGRLNQRGSYLSLNYVNIILKLQILTKKIFWLSPLQQIRNWAKWRSGDPSGPDLTNFRAYVGTLPASELGDSRVHLTQNFETYTDQNPVSTNFVARKMVLFRAWNRQWRSAERKRKLPISELCQYYTQTSNFDKSNLLDVSVTSDSQPFKTALRGPVGS